MIDAYKPMYFQPFSAFLDSYFDHKGRNILLVAESELSSTEAEILRPYNPFRTQTSPYLIVLYYEIIILHVLYKDIISSLNQADVVLGILSAKDYTGKPMKKKGYHGLHGN